MQEQRKDGWGKYSRSAPAGLKRAKHVAPSTHGDRDCFCSCPSHRVCVKSAQLPDALLFLPNLLSLLLLHAYKKNGFNPRPAVIPSFPQQ